MIRIRMRRLLSIGLLTVIVLVPVLSVTTQTPETANAAVGTGIAATLDQYWNGNAAWVFVRKQTQASTGTAGYFNGGQTVVMNDGTWYYFNRKFPGPGFCTLGVQVRKSTDKGASWTAPVTIVSPTAGTPYSCAATDGDAWYNPTENKWHYLFQCYDNSSWKGCLLSRSGSDPMGPFTIQPVGGNPVVLPKELWDSICNVPADHCSSQAGGIKKVFDEGTFDIFRYDGTYYWVAFHGYDGIRGYRGIAKTTDFQNWIAGDSSQGVPADAVHDRADSQVWRESWSGNTSIGGGAGSMVEENGYYYHLVEAADINLACTQNQNWNYGLYRSNSLTNTTWTPFPGGNPIIYSSKAPEEAGASKPCNVQYAHIFKDPQNGYTYLAYGRSSNDANYDGLYLYRLETTNNHLVNSDLWRSDDYGWNRLGSGTNLAVYRLPNNSPDGTPYMAMNCGGACSGNHSIYQDVSIPGGTGGTRTFGGKFMAEGGTGSLSLTVFQMDANYNVLQSDSLAIGAGTSWASYSKNYTLLSSARILRFQIYMNTGSLTYRADDLYLQK